MTFQPQLLVSDPQNHLPVTFDSIAHAALPFDLCLRAFGVDLATTDNERTRASTGARAGAMGAERSARCARTKNYYATQSRGRETAIWWLLSNRPLSTLRARAPLARWGRPQLVIVGGGGVDPSGARRAPRSGHSFGPPTSRAGRLSVNHTQGSFTSLLLEPAHRRRLPGGPRTKAGL